MGVISDCFMEKKEVDDPMKIYENSIIIPTKESPGVLAFKDIKNSFFNNIVIISSQLILTTNLILLGHLLYEKKIHYNLFMTYQIGVFILELFGRVFFLGLLKYLFVEKEENKNYIGMKTLFAVLIPVIMIPLSLLTYFIIKLLLQYNLEIYSQLINKEVWTKFLIFTPAIYLFELLFFLNIQLLAYHRRQRTVFFYLVCFFIAHVTLSFILLYVVEIGIIGLTISYFVNSFLFYFFTNNTIKKQRNYEDEDFIFFLFPNRQNFNSELFKLFKEKSYISLINYGDVIAIHILFFATLFTNKNQLIVNIIYINFYELICAINKGFYYNLKNYIWEKMEDADYKQKYVKVFSLYFMIITLSIFLVLVLIKYVLLDMYLFDGGEIILKNVSNQLKIIYPICILIVGIRMNLNGIIRGMSVALHPLKKLLYIGIYSICCYIFCFFLKYEIFGLWISLLIFDVFLVLESIHKANSLFPQFFRS